MTYSVPIRGMVCSEKFFGSLLVGRDYNPDSFCAGVSEGDGYGNRTYRAVVTWSY